MPTESFRDFNLRIKNLVRIGFANADEETLVKIAIREFKLKVSNLVRNNVNFKTCQSDRVFLVDFAQRISDAVIKQVNLIFFEQIIEVEINIRIEEIAEIFEEILETRTTVVKIDQTLT